MQSLMEVVILTALTALLASTIEATALSHAQTQATSVNARVAEKIFGQ